MTSSPRLQTRKLSLFCTLFNFADIYFLKTNCYSYSTMLTQDDVNKLTQVLATKEDIHGLETRVEGLEGKMENLDEKVTRLESTVIKHYKDLRERTVSILKFAEEIEIERDANEKRLRKMEAKLNLSHI